MSFPDRAYDIADASIGQQLTVRLDKRRTVRGVIVNAEPHRWQLKRSQEHVVFRVVIECGADKVHKTLHVCKLPRSK